MRGNPYYQPNYEEYYYDPPTYDWALNPETWHAPKELSRWLAREVGPVLPIAAVGLPLLAAGYSARKQYEAAKAEAAERKKYGVYEDLRVMSSNIKQRQLAQEKIRQATEKRPEPPPLTDNIADDVEDAIERVPMAPTVPPPKPKSRPSSPMQLIKPTLRKLNIPLEQPIMKNKSTFLMREHSGIKAVAKKIDDTGSIDAVLDDPEMREKYPNVVNLLNDIPSALTNEEPFPKEFEPLLDDETLTNYRMRRDEGKEIRRREEADRVKAENAAWMAEKAARRAEKAAIKEAKEKAKIAALTDAFRSALSATVQSTHDIPPPIVSPPRPPARPPPTTPASSAAWGEVAAEITRGTTLKPASKRRTPAPPQPKTLEELKKLGELRAEKKKK